jgi:hypothetical protein
MESSVSVLAPRGASRVLRGHPVDWRFDRMTLFLAVVSLVFWCEAGWRQGAALFGDAAPAKLAIAAGLMLFSRLGANALEALGYSLWWRARGARLPYGRFLVALVALSLVDRFSLALTALAARTPELGPLLAPLAGPQTLGARFDPGPGLRAAGGALGALTLSRIVITAWLQSARTGRRMRGALAVTALVWLGSRVALWWLLDLARGVSPGR